MSVPLMVESEEFVSPVLPDRADQPVSETTERFLRAIVERVPLEQIEELHLFSPLRQGTVETGIAVIAGTVLLPPSPVEEVPPLELSLEEATDREAVEAMDEETAESSTQHQEEVEDSADEASAEPVGTPASAVDAESANPVEASADSVDDSPYADEPTETPQDIEDVVAAGKPVNALVTEQPLRHTVYTARYRLVIKGPERGRWESDVVEEAHAPLVTVETVVRGVQRRAGEDTEIVRYNAHQIARALRIPLG